MPREQENRRHTVMFKEGTVKGLSRVDNGGRIAGTSK